MLRPTHRSQSDRLYYINIGRNIARDAATTHFILANDIELYPSRNLIPQFLQMMARSGGVNLNQRLVYVLPPFEVSAVSRPPETKTQLQEMLQNGDAIRFHRYLCDFCHRIPDHQIWEANAENRTLAVFTCVTRTDSFDFWEPFYIGTNEDPYFDERVPYEGGSNKMIQAYTMCMMNYRFGILNNAFLIHRPGFKTYRKPQQQQNVTKMMFLDVARQYDLMFGPNPDCSMFHRNHKVTAAH